MNDASTTSEPPPMMPGRALDVVIAAFERAHLAIYSVDVVLPAAHRTARLSICPSSSGGPAAVNQGSYAALSALGAQSIARRSPSGTHDVLDSGTVRALPGWEVGVIVSPTGQELDPADEDAVAELVAEVDAARAEQDAEATS